MAEKNKPVDNIKSQDEEIDLGSLFKIIGKGITNLFMAIGKFFGILFHLFIILLFFLKNLLTKQALNIPVQ